MGKGLQLTLGLRLNDEATFDNFYSASTEQIQLINYLKAFVRGRKDWFVYLYGPSGVGRSHLLQACCQLIERSVYLAASELIHLEPAVLEDLDDCSLVAIDDIQQLLGNALWEEALFHLYNRIQQSAHCLIVSANTTPHTLVCQLPDLQSRLCLGSAFYLPVLDDSKKLSLLQDRAKARGMEVTDRVGQFLLNHFPRDTSLLFKSLDALERSSLREQRKLTIPFVKEVLGKG